MTIYSCLCVKYVPANNSFNRILFVFRQQIGNSRNYNAMARKVNEGKPYIAIPIGEQTATQSNFYSFVFRRCKSFRTNNNKKPDFSRLLALAKPERWNLLGAVSLLFISSTVSMAVPYSLGKVLDIIYSNSDDKDEARIKLNQVCGVLVAVFLVGALANFGRIYLMSTSGYRMTQALRNKVFSSILRQEQGWFDKRPTGELLNRLSSDTQIVGQALTSNISDGLRSTIMVVAGSGMMFYMSPQLALVGLAIVPPIAGVAVIYGRFVRKITTQVQDSLAEATQIAEERISNIRTVKMFGNEPKEETMYKNAIQKVLNISYRESKARAIFYAMTGLSGNVIIISVLYYGGVMVSAQTITIGNLSSFLLYAAYIGVSVGGLSSFFSEVNKSIGAASRLWEILDREPVIPLHGGITPLEPPKGHIVFKNIDFNYPARDDITVLQDLDLEITPGKTVAVVGPSGSGKSTLAALLLRLYDPSKGLVFIDDEDIVKLDPTWIKKSIGTVSQEPTLFSSSIKENILYGAENPEEISEEEFLRVAREANVLEFVEKLPQGFDTVVGERGIMLSGGQKQRVAIARALIKNPPILLLDEATSALDAQSEHLVQEALECVMKGRTVLTIAHRLSTIQNADTIAVLQKGKVVEQGSYRDLLSRENGVFKELMKHQTFQPQ